MHSPSSVQQQERVRSGVLPSWLPERRWYPTRLAAELLGTTERTLRRKLSGSHWRDGVHYRWVSRGSRRIIEVNLREAIRLMELRGW